MPCQQRNSGERKIQQRSQERVEAIRIGEGVALALIEVKAGAPELRVGALDDDAAGLVGADGLLDVAEG